jgi:replication factor C subunit 3/5
MNTNYVNQNVNQNVNKPWVEKYRPSTFNDIILDDINKTIFSNMIKKNYIPNLLFYGPPGTGKTTTIINLIKTFQENNNQINKGLMIHLNASDERGIDTIRNQIMQFVNSKSLFTNGIKFVILDEVDYMTKSAQHALKYLIQTYNVNVRFCLICNYISKIDESLQNDLLRLRFNQLPEEKIIKFLYEVSEKENIDISVDKLKSIQTLYKSDIRSMINYIQLNHTLMNNIIDNDVWEKLLHIIIQHKDHKIISEHIDNISKKYNMMIKNIIKDFLNYIIRFHPHYISDKLLKCIEFILHIPNINNEYIKNYFSLSLNDFFEN